MTLITYDDKFLDHDVHGHPECAQRLVSIVSHLKKSGLWNQCKLIKAKPATDENILLVHSKTHLENIKKISEQGGWIDSDTYCSKNSFEIAKLSCGATLQIADKINGGVDYNAFCLIRPPGHHATKNQAMGFCLFNNIAILAKYIIAKKWAKRILIIDWDVHHGNGTQDIFYDDPNIGYFSLHRAPFYPGTGSEKEIGIEKGEGTTWNYPFDAQTPISKILDTTKEKIQEAAGIIKPDWILISCGFDAYSQDPLGGLGFEADHYGELTRFTQSIAKQYSNQKIISLLEGGYNLNALGILSEHHLTELIQS